MGIHHQRRTNLFGAFLPSEHNQHKKYYGETTTDDASVRRLATVVIDRHESAVSCRIGYVKPCRMG
jgi:hypothetical protein